MPAEVKATTGNAKSAKTILKQPEKYHVERIIKLGGYNVGRPEGILTLPWGFYWRKIDAHEGTVTKNDRKTGVVDLLL